MTQFKAYCIQCITNLHVGSGDANFGVVDKLVQRDPVTNLPTIHSSSLKGALREHFKQFKDEKFVNKVFGNDPKADANSTGNYKFLCADLLAIPIRSNYDQYALTFSHNVVESVNQKAKLLGLQEVFIEKGKLTNDSLYKDNPPSYPIFGEDVKLAPKPYMNPLSVKGIPNLEAKFAVVKNGSFDTLIRNLPVIARNYIENGTSDNLWYEEIVPHQTLFITYMATSNEQPEFEAELLKDFIQIGGNATIGYGLCKFTKIEKI